LADLHAAGTLVLSCANGHRYDVNRRGYVSLIAGSRRLIGDSPAMLDARDTFLERGWYSFVRDALSVLVAAENARTVADIGCGTGYYLRGVLTALTAGAAERPADQRSRDAAPRALAMDLSAPAVARTVRAANLIPGPDTADVVINVFAPRNAAEFHRILAPGGLLAVVVPHQTHLKELRADGLALDVHENKSADLITAMQGRFSLESSHDLSDVLSLSPADVAALIGMGPSAHHMKEGVGPSDPAAPSSHRPVTVAFRLLAFRRTQV
jgi:23S rRNA (guanine745-N1)-methyltransferase